MEENMSWVIFCDLDGVLADFDKGVLNVTGKLPHEQSLSSMWRSLARTPDFYAKLDWMADGKLLWEYLTPHNPTILSGLPIGNWARKQKTTWVGIKLGWEVPAIFGWSKEKHLDAMKRLGTLNLEGCILVDDRAKTKTLWEGVGGTFVLHKNTKDSIEQLKALGV
jgi:hypothetical protein